MYLKKAGFKAFPILKEDLPIFRFASVVAKACTQTNIYWKNSMKTNQVIVNL